MERYIKGNVPLVIVEYYVQSCVYLCGCDFCADNFYLHKCRPVHTYRIYPNKSRTHINACAQINAGVQHSKVNRCLYKMQKGLI